VCVAGGSREAGGGGSEAEGEGSPAGSPTKKRAGPHIWTSLKTQTQKLRQRSMERLKSRGPVRANESGGSGGGGGGGGGESHAAAANGHGRGGSSPVTPPLATPDDGGEEFDALFEVIFV
jgi:hypothetical protein